MPLPYVNYKLEPYKMGLQTMITEEGIAVFRALVDNGYSPCLRQTPDGCIIKIGLAEESLVSQLVEAEEVAKRAAPGARCVLERDALAIS